MMNDTANDARPNNSRKLSRPLRVPPRRLRHVGPAVPLRLKPLGRPNLADSMFERRQPVNKRACLIQTSACEIVRELSKEWRA